MVDILKAYRARRRPSWKLQIVLTKCDLVERGHLVRRVTALRSQLQETLREVLSSPPVDALPPVRALEPLARSRLPVLMVSAKEGGGLVPLQKELAALCTDTPRHGHKPSIAYSDEKHTTSELDKKHRRDSSGFSSSGTENFRLKASQRLPSSEPKRSRSNESNSFRPSKTNSFRPSKPNSFRPRESKRPTESNSFRSSEFKKFRSSAPRALPLNTSSSIPFSDDRGSTRRKVETVSEDHNCIFQPRTVFD
jgi:hypothetical protein